jgi:hypothetical protein
VIERDGESRVVLDGEDEVRRQRFADVDHRPDGDALAEP